MMESEISGQLLCNCPLPKTSTRESWMSQKFSISEGSGLQEISRTKFLIVPKILIFEISVSLQRLLMIKIRCSFQSSACFN